MLHAAMISRGIWDFTTTVLLCTNYRFPLLPSRARHFGIKVRPKGEGGVALKPRSQDGAKYGGIKKGSVAEKFRQDGSKYGRSKGKGGVAKKDGKEGVAEQPEAEGAGQPRLWTKNPWKLRELRFSKHISNLVKKSRQEEAVQVLEQMKKSRVRPNEVVYNTIISGYAKQGDVKMAFKTFNELKKRALLPTDHTYSSMFAACGAVGPPASVTLDKVRAEMERRNVCPNTITINAMISALALCGRVQEAMQVYLDMSKMHSEPDLCTFGALLLAVGKDRTKGLDVAKRVWSEMLASNLQVDMYSYNMLLQVLRDAGLEGVVNEEGRSTAQLRKRTVPLVSMDVLLGEKGGATAKGKVGGATAKNPKGKVGGVEVKSLEGDKLTERSMLYVRGKVDFELCEGQTLELYVGSPRQDGPLTTRWLGQRSIETFYAVLKQNRLKPDMHTFHLLVHLTLDPAHLLVTMSERKISPDNKFMVAAVTQQARQLHSLHGAKVLLQYSRKLGLDLGQVGYQAVATGCHHPKDGMELLKKMKADKVEPNNHVLGTLVGHAVRDHNYEYLTDLIRSMMHLNFVPNSTILEMLDTAATRKVKSPQQHKRQNGFKGFYMIWKRKVHPETITSETDQETEEDFNLY